MEEPVKVQTKVPFKGSGYSFLNLATSNYIIEDFVPARGNVTTNELRTKPEQQPSKPKEPKASKGAFVMRELAFLNKLKFQTEDIKKAIASASHLMKLNETEPSVRFVEQHREETEAQKQLKYVSRMNKSLTIAASLQVRDKVVLTRPRQLLGATSITKQQCIESRCMKCSLLPTQVIWVHSLN